MLASALRAGARATAWIRRARERPSPQAGSLSRAQASGLPKRSSRSSSQAWPGWPPSAASAPSSISTAVSARTVLWLRSGRHEQPLGDTFKSFAEPSSDKLLPDVPPLERYPDGSCRPTLVIDLEQTLVTSSWDRKYGWRAVKGPESTRSSANVGGVRDCRVQPDAVANRGAHRAGPRPQGMYIRHQLYRDATLYTRGTYIKDLKLNRDLAQVVVIDEAIGGAAAT